MKALLAALALCMTLVSCGAHAPPPLVVTSFGGQGFIKGYIWGQPFELETWHIALEDQGGELVYCPVTYINIAGIQAHGTIDLSVLNALGLEVDLPPAPQMCIDEFGVLELMAPTYSAPVNPLPPATLDEPDPLN